VGSPGRLAQALAQQIPEGHINARKGMIGLEHILALRTHQIADPVDVGHIVQALPQDRRGYGFAGAV